MKSADGPNAFETWILHRPGFDTWLKATEHMHETHFHVTDKEGLARVVASSYVQQLLFTRGAEVPIARFLDTPMQISGSEELRLLVEWVIERQRHLVPELRVRLVELFEAVQSGAALRGRLAWAIEIESEILGMLDNTEHPR